MDACDGDLTSKVKRISTVDTNVLGPAVVTYQVSDGCNLQINLTREVIVRDTLAPRIHAPSVGIIHLRLGTPYLPPRGVSARDEFDGTLDPASIQFQPSGFENEPGMHTVFAVAQDFSGNIARVPIQTVYMLPETAARTPSEATIEMKFDTELAIRDSTTPAIAVSLFVRFDQRLNGHEAQLLLQSRLANSGYSEPFCLPADDDHSLCRVDSLDMSASLLDRLADTEGVVALAPKAMPVTAYHMGLPNPNDTPAGILGLALGVKGADSIKSVGCDRQYCTYEVDRGQVKGAVPVARPHPHTSFVVDAEGQSASQIEKELLAAGLFPLAVNAIPNDNTQYTVLVAGYFTTSVLNALAIPRVTEVELCFKLHFTLILADNLPAFRVIEALHAVGIAPHVLEQNGTTYHVVTATSVYSPMLDALAARDDVMAVSTIAAFNDTQPLLEAAFPFQYGVDVDFSVSDPNEGLGVGTHTPTSVIVALFETLAQGRAFEPACTMDSSRLIGSCRVQSSFEITQAQRNSTFANAPYVTRFEEEDDSSLRQHVAKATGVWIRGTIGLDQVQLDIKASVEQKHQRRDGNPAVYTVVTTLHSKEAPESAQKYRYSLTANFEAGVSNKYELLKDSIVSIIGEAAFDLLYVEDSAFDQYKLRTIGELSAELLTNLEAVAQIRTIGQKELVSARMSPADAALILNHDLERRYVEISVQGYSMVAAQVSAVRVTQYTAPDRSEAGRPETTHSPTSQGSTANVGVIGGASAGGAVLILIAAGVLYRFKSKRKTKVKQSALEAEERSSNQAIVNPLYIHGRPSTIFYHDIAPASAGDGSATDGIAVEGAYGEVDEPQSDSQAYSKLDGPYHRLNDRRFAGTEGDETSVEPKREHDGEGSPKEYFDPAPVDEVDKAPNSDDQKPGMYFDPLPVVPPEDDLNDSHM
eukprot:TRINITY_DN9511_c0_g1_i1.p1 TRINITY_DN9511_c0_g1~~TRINITY_DN9511_c0_g1_i1.p1  ORF type:complete len:945 (+),score=195.21 TRINITY_DN9511_c0_g1_i1:59-2836(+)